MNPIITVWDPHVPVLYEWAHKYQGGTAIELGFDWGHSTSAFLAAGMDTWSVDINPECEDRAINARGWKNLPGLHLIIGDSAAPDIRHQLPAVCDLLYVDSDHSYEHCLAELRIYGPRVRPGGVILCHDTWMTSVTKAISDWCQVEGLTWYDTPQPGQVQHWQGMAVIRR